MSLMGSDTLSGTPAGDLKATAIFEVGSASSPWRNTTWEYNFPPTGNGVMWLSSAAYHPDAPSSLAFTLYYTFINTGPAITGAIMYCGVDNYGYIVLNGVKYPSTNPNMSLGYEGIEVQSNFTVNIPTGLNTMELRAVNAGPVGNNVWQNQSLNGGPVAMWMAIRTSSSGPVLVKTDATWNCRQFNYPAKFVRPLSLGDVAENAGFTNKPYSLAALAGKVMYDNSKNVTTLTSPVSLFTADFKTFYNPVQPPAGQPEYTGPPIRGNTPLTSVKRAIIVPQDPNSSLYADAIAGRDGVIQYLPGDWTEFNYNNMPSDMTEYGLIWDVCCITSIPQNIQNIYQYYLYAGGAIFIHGEHEASIMNGPGAARNTSIAAFVTLMGGGSVSVISNYAQNDVVTFRSVYIYNNYSNSPYEIPTNGSFATFGTGKLILNNSSCGLIWGRKTMSVAPSGCLIAYLDINTVQGVWRPGTSPYGSIIWGRQDFVTNLGSVLFNS